MREIRTRVFLLRTALIYLGTLFTIMEVHLLCFSDNMEDELRFGADHYLKKLAERRSFLEKFWGGIKVTCIFMALVSLIVT